MEHLIKCEFCGKIATHKCTVFYEGTNFCCTECKDKFTFDLTEDMKLYPLLKVLEEYEETQKILAGIAAVGDTLPEKVIYVIKHYASQVGRFAFSRKDK